MAISVADNFSYKGTKPMDERLQYNTVADMKSVVENTLYDGCMAYVKATKKYYTFDSSNETDVTLGRWRESETGTTITIDSTPTENSTNAVQSGGTYTALNGKVDKVNGKGLSTEDYTPTEKTKLSGVAEGAQVNTISSITLNGDAVTPDANKNVALTVITNTVNNLLNYYLKTETYSKTEVDTLLSAVSGATFESVSELPTTNIKTNVIYLVPKQTPETSNIKDEYINLDGTTAGWELIGDTGIDLSDYVTTTALNIALADYTTTADLTTLLSGKVDKVNGKQLSTEDYTSAEKTKLAGLSNYDDTALSGRVSDIEDVVPSTATTSNKLATMADVGGTSGHTIEDSTGVDMTARTNLQFVGATVTDDSTNDRTVVTVVGGGQTIQYDIMPTASSENEDDTIQYIGATTSVAPIYTNGFFYKCVAQGTDPKTYAWEQTNVQPKGMNYKVVTELPTQNIDTETVYALKPSKNEIISDGSATSITVPYGSASGSKSYHSFYDIEAGTVLDISVTLSGISANVPGCRIDVIINGVSTTIANGITTGTTSNISAQYTLNDNFVAKRDTFDIVVEHTQYAGDVTVDIGKLSILGYVPKKEYDYEYYLNTDGTSDGWRQIALSSEGDERIKPEITEMGVKFDDGLRPYIKVDVSTIIPSFADATWDDIAMISDLYYSGDLSLEDIRNVWKAGDSKNILISAMPATGVNESHAEQTVSLKLVDFNHDTLVTAQGEKTKALLTLGFELAENGAIHTSSVDAEGAFGWENCARRTWCNNVCKDAIPENLRSFMKSVIKTTDKINASLTGITTNDYVFIPTINEYIGRTINATEAGAQYTLHAGYGGTQYAYHAMSGARTKTMCTSSFYEHHWSEVTYVARNQLATTSGGASGTNNVTTSSGLMPHFCI